MLENQRKYTSVGKDVLPIFNDPNLKANLKIDRSRADAVSNNTFEVCIHPYQELTRFTRRLIILLLILQSVIMLSIISFLYIRVLSLESEYARLALLSTEGETRLTALANLVQNIGENGQDILSMDCSVDSNDTDLDEEGFHLDISLEDGKEEEDLMERYKRFTHVDVDAKQKKKDQRRKFREKAIRNRNMEAKRKRLICHKCKNSTNRNQLWNKLRNFNGYGHAGLPTPDMDAIHFRGGLPEVHFEDKGTIGPWFYDGAPSSTNRFKDFSLEQKNSSVLILSDSFFFIYAQVYYLSSGGSNSFSIIRKSANDKNSGEILATCSSGTVNSITNTASHEVSCFTATVCHLHKGDRLQLVEREKNRRVLFRDGQTYFGLVRISSVSSMLQSHAVSQINTTTENIKTTPTPVSIMND